LQSNGRGGKKKSKYLKNLASHLRLNGWITAMRQYEGLLSGKVVLAKGHSEVLGEKLPETFK